MVVVGTVTEVNDGQFVPAPEPEDFKGTQYLAVVVDIDETLLGASEGDQVEIRWFGYEVEPDGSKGPQEGNLTPTNARYSGAAEELEGMTLGELREILASEQS